MFLNLKKCQFFSSNCKAGDPQMAQVFLFVWIASDHLTWQCHGVCKREDWQTKQVGFLVKATSLMRWVKWQANSGMSLFVLFSASLWTCEQQFTTVWSWLETFTSVCESRWKTKVHQLAFHFPSLFLRFGVSFDTFWRRRKCRKRIRTRGKHRALDFPSPFGPPKEGPLKRKMQPKTHQHLHTNSTHQMHSLHFAWILQNLGCMCVLRNFLETDCSCWGKALILSSKQTVWQDKNGVKQQRQSDWLVTICRNCFCGHCCKNKQETFFF